MLIQDIYNNDTLLPQNKKYMILYYEDGYCTACSKIIYEICNSYIKKQPEIVFFALCKMETYSVLSAITNKSTVMHLLNEDVPVFFDVKKSNTKLIYKKMKIKKIPSLILVNFKKKTVFKVLDFDALSSPASFCTPLSDIFRDFFDILD
ncbi:MAG: hypothetical protein LBR36_02710 [Bacteroidales bacterium]|jgi:hypothetical protein|nr:hypothetical protein [Bacteroidales bacterium]